MLAGITTRDRSLLGTEQAGRQRLCPANTFLHLESLQARGKDAAFFSLFLRNPLGQRWKAQRLTGTWLGPGRHCT